MARHRASGAGRRTATTSDLCASCAILIDETLAQWHERRQRTPRRFKSATRTWVATALRSEVLPNVPTVAEFLPGYEASAWNGVGVPKDTPAEIIDKLNKEINAALADPKIRVRIAELGATVFPSSPSELGKFIAEETEKWGKVVKFAGIKAE